MDPTLGAILKYKDHPSIPAIQSKCKYQIKFALKKWTWHLQVLKRKLWLENKQTISKFGYPDQNYKG